MASNLTAQVRDIAQVTTAVAGGDLSRKITVEVKGEVDDLKNTINTMVDQLNSFSSEVTRVALEVGKVQEVDDVGRLDEVLSGVPLDGILTGASSPESSNWNRAASERHHWQTLSMLENELTGDVSSNVTHLLDRLAAAQFLYRTLAADGVSFEGNSSGDHLQQWLDALRSFQRLIGMSAS